ncbi:MAG: NUDIX domain-containing protein [Candidatus Aenigmarchaeota archaeon]|nr:NUDIX domain-containing protein [Candidatus Aenigmarchaeota archaeon]
MVEYKGEVFGDLKIPFVVLHEDAKKPYSEDEVETNLSSSIFEIPDSIVRNFKEEVVEKKRKEAEEKGKAFFDGPMTRLEDYTVDDTDHKLYLYLERTSYFTFAATNKSIDKEMVREMMKLRGDSYLNLNDGLANPIGVNVGVVSESDNVIIITRRSEKLSQYPGLYGIPAGFMNPDKDKTPFDTARREVEEEMGIDVNDLKMIGIGRAGDDRHVEALMSAITDYTTEEIEAAPKSGKWEHVEINYVDFTPKDVMNHLTKTISEEPAGVPPGTGVWIPGKSPSWVPAQWRSVMDILINEYGFKDVWEEYKNKMMV